MFASLFHFLGSRLGLALAAVTVLALAAVGVQTFRSTQLQLDRVHLLIADSSIAPGHEVEINLSQLKLLIARAEGQAPEDVKPSLEAMIGTLSEVSERFADQLSRIKGSMSGIVDRSVLRTVLDDGAEAVEHLRAIVALGNAAATTDDGDLAALLAELDREAGFVQGLMYAFFVNINAIEEQIMQRQSDLLIGQGAVHGVILAVVTAISFASLAILRREMVTRAATMEAEKKAEFLAYYDPLTELPNRARFHEFGEELLSSMRSVALVLIDLDNFKEINDRFGHAMGDAVLSEVGRRLGTEAEENRGLAVRLGGDEFAMLLPSDNTAFLHRLCAGLIDLISESVDHGGESVRPAASIGLATASQMSRGSPTDLEMLTRFADFALYASKQAGRGRYTLYESELDRQFSERREMLKDLPDAIRQGDLSVYLQPKVDIWTWKTYGFEALVRWNRRGKVVPPGKFITIAEEGGYIKAIDRRMILDATLAIASWNSEKGTDFSVSVNISALHLLDEEDTLELVRLVEASPLPAERLTLEITETVQLADWRRVTEAIGTLRQAGCRISIDDFGTGYSSLAYLRTIPADELKIDKSLVAEIETSNESQFILDAVIDLARSLDMTVVVEGIERQSQVTVLSDLGCRLGQGFLYGRPQPADKALLMASEVSHVAGAEMPAEPDATQAAERPEGPDGGGDVIAFEPERRTSRIHNL